MNLTHKLSNAVLIATACVAFQAHPVQAFRQPARPKVLPSALWTPRSDAELLAVLSGAGGASHRPMGKFTFVKEEPKGTSPKFEIVDEQGVHWKVKLGEESKSETAAARLMWAAGYFTDEDYYLPELRVEKLPRLIRGHEFVTGNTLVHGLRLERDVANQKKSGKWGWFNSPLAGTKEFNGLRVMMALINNWDLKEENNAIYEAKDEERRYVITDLGASFGATGSNMARSKSNLADYSGSPFIQKVTGEHVDFYLTSRPFALSAIDIPYYVSRTHMQDIVKKIPIADAKWLGKQLRRLSAEQIRDCFRAAGYNPQEVQGFAKVVQARIDDLNRLP